MKGSVDALIKLAESNAAREELEKPLSEVSLNRVFLVKKSPLGLTWV